MEKVKNKYMNRLKDIQIKCDNLDNENDLKNLFNGVFIMLINNILNFKEKIFLKEININKKNIEEKISKLHLLIDILENNNIVIDIIIRGYILYFYKMYREYVNNWDIECFLKIEEEELKEKIVNIADKENIVKDVDEYLLIFKDIYLMIKYLEENDIIQIFFILNNLNIITDKIILLNIIK